MEDRRAIRQHGAMMLGTLFRPVWALCMIALVSVGTTACGKTSNSTSTAPRVARATTVANAQEHIQENTPFDSDKDTDGAHPDEDESNKPVISDRDNDGDNSNAEARHDSDDRSVLRFGHPASASDKRQIGTLIRRYYAAAAAEDGAKACSSLLYSTYAEAVPEDYGTSPPGPSYAQGTSCSVVMTLIFKHFHGQIAVRLPKLKVSVVRTQERQGLAVLSFDRLSEHEIRVVREGRAWKILALIDNELP